MDLVHLQGPGLSQAARPPVLGAVRSNYAKQKLGELCRHLHGLLQGSKRVTHAMTHSFPPDLSKLSTKLDSEVVKTRRASSANIIHQCEEGTGTAPHVAPPSPGSWLSTTRVLPDLGSITWK